MTDSVNGWAVGDNGAILQYSGSAWGVVTSPTTQTLRSVYMLSASDGWAAGDSGTLLRYQNGLWNTYSSPTTSQLNSLYLADGTHGWAVGASGTILHYDGSLWLSVSGPVSTNLNSVTEVTPQLAWAVGDGGTILQWTGIGWYTYTPTPPLSGNPDLNGIFTLSNGFGFIVGAPTAPGGQATVLQVPTASPVPETTAPQLLLLASLGAVLVTVRIRRRKRY
jgi:photosystem II stability/assembly factor-like uncharacterized protein